MLFDKLSPILDRLGWSLPLFLAAFLALLFAKALYEWTETFGFSDQLTEKDNPAFGTALLGYILGVTLALTGAFPAEPALGLQPLLSALVMLAMQGVLIAILMRVSVWVVSRGILYRFGVREEMIRDRNVGAGAVLAGGSIAAGLVLHGALSGQSDGPVRALVDLLIFWVVGQLILVGGAWLFIHVVKFDVQKELEADNIPAGFSLAGFLIAVGIVINAALSGASSDLTFELILTLLMSVVGLIFLVCSAIIAARVFMPHSPVAKEIAVDRNSAAGLVSAACFIAMAVLLARVIAS